jgi:hypothetical protein
LALVPSAWSLQNKKLTLEVPPKTNWYDLMMSYQRSFGQNFSLKPKALKSKPTLSIKSDNTSSMWLDESGKVSSGKHTHHFHIKFFYITDLIKQQEQNPNWILSNWGYDHGLHDKTFSWCQVWMFSQTHYEPPI